MSEHKIVIGDEEQAAGVKVSEPTAADSGVWMNLELMIVEAMERAMEKSSPPSTSDDHSPGTRADA